MGRDYHKSRSSPSDVVASLSITDDGVPLWKGREFLLIAAEYEKSEDGFITGFFSNENVQYRHKGFRQHGHKLNGMSGGALFFPPEKIQTTPRSGNDFFQFAGIGIEYSKGEKRVKGVSAASIKDIINGLKN